MVRNELKASAFHSTAISGTKYPLKKANATNHARRTILLIPLAMVRLRFVALGRIQITNRLIYH